MPQTCRVRGLASTAQHDPPSRIPLLLGPYLSIAFIGIHSVGPTMALQTAGCTHD